MKKLFAFFVLVAALCATTSVASAQFYPPYGGGYYGGGGMMDDPAFRAGLYGYPPLPMMGVGGGYYDARSYGVEDPCAAYYVLATQSSRNGGVMGALGDGLAIGVAIDGIRRRDPAKVIGAGVYGVERVGGAIQRRRQLDQLRRACEAFEAQQMAAEQAQAMPSQAGYGQQGGGYYGEEALRRVPPPEATQSVRPVASCSQGQMAIRNESGWPIHLRRVYAGGGVQELILVANGQAVCGDPIPANGGWAYEAWARINVNGGVAADGAELRTRATSEWARTFAVGTADGWTFQPPPRSERDEIIR